MDEYTELNLMENTTQVYRPAILAASFALGWLQHSEGREVIVDKVKSASDRVRPALRLHVKASESQLSKERIRRRK